jgi:hypothetical protein
VKVGRKKRLVVEVLSTGTGAVQSEFPSPFQNPKEIGGPAVRSEVWRTDARRILLSK